MLKEIIHTGETEEEAINSACMVLGVPREECEWEIVERARKSFFGLRKYPAKVRVWTEVAEEVAVKTEKPSKVAEVKKEAPSPIKREEKKPVVIKEKEAPKQKQDAFLKNQELPQSMDELDEFSKEKIVVAESYVNDLLKGLGVEGDTKSRVENGGAWISIFGKSMGALIGRKGETLNAIQYLTTLTANRLEGEYLRITVDAGDYRLKRNKSLEEMAERFANQVIKTDITRTLEPMTPSERRIIHAAVSNINGVTSISVGNEPYRKVVIKTATSKSRPDRRNDSSSGRRDSRPASKGFKGKKEFTPREEKPSEPIKTKEEPIITPETTADTPLYGKIELD